MFIAILYATLSIAYAFKKVGKLGDILNSEEWPTILWETLFSSDGPGWKFILVVAIFSPLGLCIDAYQKIVLDEDDLKPKEKSKKKKSKKKG